MKHPYIAVTCLVLATLGVGVLLFIPRNSQSVNPLSLAWEQHGSLLISRSGSKKDLAVRWQNTTTGGCAMAVVTPRDLWGSDYSIVEGLAFHTTYLDDCGSLSAMDLNAPGSDVDNALDSIKRSGGHMSFWFSGFFCWTDNNDNGLPDDGEPTNGIWSLTSTGPTRFSLDHKSGYTVAKYSRDYLDLEITLAHVDVESTPDYPDGLTPGIVYVQLGGGERLLSQLPLDPDVFFGFNFTTPALSTLVNDTSIVLLPDPYEEDDTGYGSAYLRLEQEVVFPDSSLPPVPLVIGLDEPLNLTVVAHETSSSTPLHHDGSSPLEPVSSRAMFTHAETRSIVANSTLPALRFTIGDNTPVPYAVTTDDFFDMEDDDDEDDISGDEWVMEILGRPDVRNGVAGVSGFTVLVGMFAAKGKGKRQRLPRSSDKELDVEPFDANWPPKYEDSDLADLDPALAFALAASTSPSNPETSEGSESSSSSNPTSPSSGGVDADDINLWLKSVVEHESGVTGLEKLSRMSPVTVADLFGPISLEGDDTSSSSASPSGPSIPSPPLPDRAGAPPAPAPPRDSTSNNTSSASSLSASSLSSKQAIPVPTLPTTGPSASAMSIAEQAGAPLSPRTGRKPVLPSGATTFGGSSHSNASMVTNPSNSPRPSVDVPSAPAPPRTGVGRSRVNKSPRRLARRTSSFTRINNGKNPASPVGLVAAGPGADALVAAAADYASPDVPSVPGLKKSASSSSLVTNLPNVTDSDPTVSTASGSSNGSTSIGAQPTRTGPVRYEPTIGPWTARCGGPIGRVSGSGVAVASVSEWHNKMMYRHRDGMSYGAFRFRADCMSLNHAFTVKIRHPSYVVIGDPYLVQCDEAGELTSNTPTLPPDSLLIVQDPSVSVVGPSNGDEAGDSASSASSPSQVPSPSSSGLGSPSQPPVPEPPSPRTASLNAMTQSLSGVGEMETTLQALVLVTCSRYPACKFFRMVFPMSSHGAPVVGPSLMSEPMFITSNSTALIKDAKDAFEYPVLDTVTPSFSRVSDAPAAGTSSSGTVVAVPGGVRVKLSLRSGILPKKASNIVIRFQQPSIGLDFVATNVTRESDTVVSANAPQLFVPAVAIIRIERVASSVRVLYFRTRG